MPDTTLTALVGAGDLLIPVDAALSDADGEFLVQIEQEFLLVERRGASLNPQVRRGMFGTTPASHVDTSDVILVTPVVQTAAPADPPDDDLATKTYVDDAIAAAIAALP